MTDRQFLWGLANGVMMLAIAGAFWLGLGIGLSAHRLGGIALAALTMCQVGGCAALMWGAVRLRRRAGFHRSQLHAADGQGRLETRHIMAVIRWTVMLQAVLISAAVWWCVRAGAESMIWPSIGLVVSLHLIPLARVFHVRTYYVTAAAGTAVSVSTAASGLGAVSQVLLAAGMSAVMWLSAAYVLMRAGEIAARALREPWAV